MNVIFYSSASDERSKEICKGLESSSHNIGLELHRSWGSLESRLRQPLHGIAVMLLYLCGEKDIIEMIVLQELIIDIPLILIMCDTAGEAMAKARLVRPRIIFRADDNLKDMCLVFEKMLARQITYEQQQSKIGGL